MGFHILFCQLTLANFVLLILSGLRTLNHSLFCSPLAFCFQAVIPREMMNLACDELQRLWIKGECWSSWIGFLLYRTRADVQGCVGCRQSTLSHQYLISTNSEYVSSCHIRTQQWCKIPLSVWDDPVACPIIWSADMCHVPGLWFSVIFLGVRRREHTEQVLAISVIVHLKCVLIPEEYLLA